MGSSQELALTVEERSEGRFFWVLIEACDAQGSDAFHYKPFRCAETAQDIYWDALLLGMAALRRIAAAEAASPTARPAPV